MRRFELTARSVVQTTRSPDEPLVVTCTRARVHPRGTGLMNRAIM